jgi:putative permease
MTPDQIRQKIIKRERWIRIGIVVAILTLSMTILLAVQGMLTTCLLAFVVTYLFKPIVNYFERRGMSRTLAIVIPFLVTGLLIAALGGFFVPRIVEQASSLQTELPRYVTGITELISRHTRQINTTLSPFIKFDAAAKGAEWIQESTAGVLNNVPNVISQFFITMLLAPLFAFFMLRDGRNVSRKMLNYVPNNLFEVGLNLTYQINQQLGGFIRARLLESLIVGGVVWVGLYILGFPYAALLAVFAGVTNLIPYVGPIIGAVPGVIVALVNHEASTTVALVTFVYLLAQIVDMVVIIPLVVAKIVDLHPVTVVIVIIMGGQIMGVLGMIISVPVASIVKLTFTEFYNHIVDFRG